ncbi:PREDICTED: dmX-like protein 1, partial [Priapulus caudatus]|uniref:DmX-like protein 1 n=1 Tax=Priapulus caudatus TaxID=37621 RepID=A0ABM1F660_PRICU
MSSRTNSVLKLSSMVGSSSGSSGGDARRKKRCGGGDDAGAGRLAASQDRGLFEAARLASPVLPQYHPKQLMELLNCGKIRRVKAILAHLVRCISGGQATPGYNSDIEDETQLDRQRTFTKSRTLSLAGSPSDAGPGFADLEQQHGDYVEIASVPPLPLFALLAADTETKDTLMQQQNEDSTHAGTDTANLFELATMAAGVAGRRRQRSSSRSPEPRRLQVVLTPIRRLQDDLTDTEATTDCRCRTDRYRRRLQVRLTDTETA